MVPTQNISENHKAPSNATHNTQTRNHANANWRFSVNEHNITKTQKYGKVDAENEITIVTTITTIIIMIVTATHA